MSWIGLTLRRKMVRAQMVRLLSQVQSRRVSVAHTYCMHYARGPITAGVLSLTIQPNIHQADKWKRDKMMGNYERLLAMSAYRGDLTKEQDNDHTTWIIWPETAISYHQLGNAYTKNLLRDMLDDYPHDTYIISGILLRNEESDSYSNSIVVLDKNAEIISSLGAPVPLIVIVWMMNDNGSKSSCRSLDWPIHKGELCNILLIDHCKDWLRLFHVHFGVSDFHLVGGIQLSVTVIRDQASSFLFWLSVD